MATRTTEASNTLETFRVNFNGLVDDIGNVTVSNAGDQLNTSASTVVGAIIEIFAGMQLSAQINSHGQQSYLQSSNAEELKLIGGIPNSTYSDGVYNGATTTNIVTDIMAEDTMSFYLNQNLTKIQSLQTTKLYPTSGSSINLEDNSSGTTNKFSIKFVSPGDSVLDFGSTQGFAAAMAVALG